MRSYNIVKLASTIIEPLNYNFVQNKGCCLYPIRCCFYACIMLSSQQDRSRAAAAIQWSRALMEDTDGANLGRIR